ALAPSLERAVGRARIFDDVRAVEYAVARLARRLEPDDLHLILNMPFGMLTVGEMVRAIRSGRTFVGMLTVGEPVRVIRCGRTFVGMLTVGETVRAIGCGRTFVKMSIVMASGRERLASSRDRAWPGR